jgi:hypothetical protein
MMEFINNLVLLPYSVLVIFGKYFIALLCWYLAIRYIKDQWDEYGYELTDWFIKWGSFVIFKIRNGFKRKTGK